MRKANNKFRNNNSIYSLNYKFDSASPAGKFCGTALELIKKYNELAKEAHSNGNYVEMEVFRQYAEHYRKIVTEINERKNQQRENQGDAPAENESAPAAEEENSMQAEDASAEPMTAEKKTDGQATSEKKEKTTRRRSFTVVEVASSEKLPENETDAEKSVAKPKTARRVLSRKSAEVSVEQEAVAK